MIAYERSMSSLNKVKRITSHWFRIYRILWLAGGISGGILFYRRTINLIYNYLTSYGFNHPTIITEFEEITLSIIWCVGICMFLCMLFQLLFSKHMAKKYIILKWTDAYFSIPCSIGFLIASVYFFSMPSYDMLTVIWLCYLGFVLIFRIVMPVMISRGYFDNSVRAFIKK